MFGNDPGRAMPLVFKIINDRATLAFGKTLERGHLALACTYYIVDFLFFETAAEIHKTGDFPSIPFPIHSMARGAVGNIQALPFRERRDLFLPVSHRYHLEFPKSIIGILIENAVGVDGIPTPLRAAAVSNEQSSFGARWQEFIVMVGLQKKLLNIGMCLDRDIGNIAIRSHLVGKRNGLKRDLLLRPRMFSG